MFHTLAVSVNPVGTFSGFAFGGEEKRIEGMMADLRRCRAVFLLSLLLVQLVAASTEQADGTVIFVDSSSKQQYLRIDHPVSESEIPVFSYDDVATSVTVLLGGVPQLPVDDIVSSKLDSVVSPDLFRRPQAVLSLSIGGIEADLVNKGEALKTLGVKSFQQRPLVTGHSDLVFRGSLKVVALSESVEKDAQVSEEELSIMECVMGGFCTSNGDSKPQTGTVSWTLNKDETIRFDLSERVDQAFVKELAVLFRNMKRAVVSHKGSEEPAELYFGTFNGIDELKKHYGSGARTQLASKFVLHAVTKALQFLQANYNDEVVGVFTFTKATAGESLFKGTVLEKRPRILQAAAPTPGSEIYPEQQALHLSGQAVIFFTVLILLLALVLSTCCMFTMPITRDSLLYSGAKMD